VMLAVSDTGTGMPPDVIERAFEPFFTTKDEGKGTGLGLSQIFGWVKQSGGHIKIYSEIGHGTTVKLYLPRAETLGVQAPAQIEPTQIGGDETILVVEDNPNVRKTVIRQLHDLGYKTLEADSGASAMRLVDDGAEFDLLLTDVVMPGGVTGYQLVEQLRKRHSGLKVLFTSGYTELALSSDQPIHKDPLLSKPYRKQDLGRAVRAVLDQNRAPGIPRSR
jgi:CheY-like chemotaxis protein